MRLLGTCTWTKDGAGRERYAEFMRRWEEARERMQECKTDTELVRTAQGALIDGESVTIHVSRYVEVVGNGYKYLCRLADKG